MAQEDGSLLDVFNEQLASNRRSSFTWFIIGMVLCSILLAVVTGIEEQRHCGGPMWQQLLLTPVEAVTVVVATTGMYWALVVLVRLLGQRALARMSSTDLATAVALGAVIGRAALGYTPTLGAGVVALVTLFAMQALAGQVRRGAHTARVMDNRPVLLMAAGEILPENLRRTHLTEEELSPALRLAGIGHRSEIACVVLEPTGELSVLRRGAALDRRLMADVRGVEHVPEWMFEGGGR